MIELPLKPEGSKWSSMPLIEQMANIGSEVGRTYKWLCKGNAQLAAKAYVRALDLIDLTIEFGRLGVHGRSALLKELCRCRDLFTESVSTGNIEEMKWVDKYFGCFAKAYSKRLSS